MPCAIDGETGWGFGGLAIGLGPVCFFSSPVLLRHGFLCVNYVVDVLGDYIMVLLQLRRVSAVYFPSHLYPRLTHGTRVWVVMNRSVVLS